MRNTRNFSRLAAFGLAVALSGTATALLAADDQTPPQYGPGMMGAYGQGPAGLNLTPDQISKIEKIRQDLFKANEPLAQQMFQERNKMQEAYLGGIHEVLAA